MAAPPAATSLSLFPSHALVAGWSSVVAPAWLWAVVAPSQAVGPPLTGLPHRDTAADCHGQYQYVGQELVLRLRSCESQVRNACVLSATPLPPPRSPGTTTSA